MFQITNHRLSGVQFVATVNMGGRIEPSLIVLHDTAGRLDKGNSVSWFKNPSAKVSAHIVVERDGSVTQMVPFDRTAWHAGTSEWRGRKGCNAFSIGIEIVSPGKLVKRGSTAVAWFGQSWPLDECVSMKTAGHGDGFWLPYTQAQVETVQMIVEALAKAYPTISDVVGHWQISPGRKVDCSPLFPLADCHALVADRAPLPIVAVKQLQQRLTDLGYWLGTVDGAIGPRTRSAVRTFQEQNGLAITGEFNAATVQVLSATDAKPMPTGSDPSKAIDAVMAQADDAAIVKRGSEATAAWNVYDGVTSLGAALQKAEAARGVGSGLSDLLGFLMTAKGMQTGLTLIICVGVWLLAHRISRRALPAA